jgi:hypothetical protein
VTAVVEVEARPLRDTGGALLGVAAVHLLAPGSPGLPCPLRTLTGVPCPFCGMTRGVTAAAHGDLARALTLNPGSLLVIAAVVGVLVAWCAGWRLRLTIPVWLPVFVVGALWAYQLFKFASGRPL